jgi:glycosyltransferase involved in cell wall biosynthesis
VGGIAELDGHGGTLVPVGAPVALAEALVRFLASPALARRDGDAGRRYCADTRGFDVTGTRLREVYEHARATPGPRRVGAKRRRGG